jgi:kynurenine formamidase
MATHIHDLTHAIRIGTKGYPGCSRIVGWPMKEIALCDYDMLHVSMDLHIGTHVDGLKHCIPDGGDVASLPLEHCIGQAVVVDLQAKGVAGEEFEIADLQPHEETLRRYRKLLIKTGWSDLWESPAYHEKFPGVSPSCAEWLCSLGVHLVGLEQPSVHSVEHLLVHRIFFNAKVVIVEGLADLKSVPDGVVEFFAVPLRFEGGDGSPTRAFCRY